MEEHSPIVVDFTQPNTVNRNADLYCELGIPFVMGTTGGDREALEKRVIDSGNIAVIAPNMAKQIVAFQSMMQHIAQNFPGAFEGYTLQIKESHQQGKKDTSRTAKSMIENFDALGIPFTKDQIVMVRDPIEQLEMGVPNEHIDGHGWHTYTLKSADGNVLFEFTHNVNGRQVYVQGTLDAIRFLDRKLREDPIEKGKVYSMIDVLESG